MSFTDDANLKVRLVLRSFAPSSFSLIASFLVTILLIGGHMLLLSTSGTAYPKLNDILLQGYANYIVGPLTAVVNSQAVNLFLLALLWGAIGLIVYEGLAYLSRQVYEWRTVRRSINLPSEGVIRRHPLEGYFLVHLVWRILITVVTLVITIAFLPVVHFCLASPEKMLRAPSLGEFFRQLGVTCLLWIVVMHCYIVLLRWYVFRTRLTDDILY